MSAAAATEATRLAQAWTVLAEVPDPEVPAVSLCDLGIVRDVVLLAQPDNQPMLEVVLTPTYSGCPATEQIALSVRQAIEQAGLGPVRVRHQLAPAWTTDWITAQGRSKLSAYGIAPPDGLAAVTSDACGLSTQPASQQVVRIRPRNIVCPRCSSNHTERLSAFGSTACKALHRCLDCLEPFEYFKTI